MLLRTSAGLAAALLALVSSVSANSGQSGNCYPGHYNSFGSCQPCRTGSYCGGGSATQCQECPSGHTCGSGQGASQNDCNPCPSGQHKDSNGQCVNCPSNTYSNQAADSCQNCPTNQFSSPGSSSCHSCPAGSYIHNGSCNQCPSNTYSSSAGATSCTSCPSGTLSSPGSNCHDDCHGCPAGSYLHNSACTQCPANSYSSAGSTSCQQCPPNTASSPGSNCQDDCHNCPAGQQSSNGGSCTACPAGQVSTSGNSCYPCPVGTYKNGNSCMNCPAGDTTLTTGSTSVSACVPKTCPAGQTLNNYGNCVNCPANTYGGGLSSCTKCPAGTDTKGNTGKTVPTDCIKCSPGQYNPTAGESCCNCPSGTFNQISGATSCCTTCPGWSSGPGSHSPNHCSNTQHSDAHAQSCSYGATCSNRCATCTQNTITGQCPSTVCPVPTGAYGTKKRALHCSRGYTACPRFTGIGGWDCVDTRSDAEMCGGCVDMDPEADQTKGGRDCTAIPHVNVVHCAKKSCVIDSCRKGYAISQDGEECVPVGTSDVFGQIAGMYFPHGARSKRRSW